MEVSIVLNGAPPRPGWLRNNIRGTIIAADGGANICSAAKVVPRYVVGDLDSIRPRVLKKLSSKAEIIMVPGQDRTDFQKSLQFAHTLGAKTIYVFAALGLDTDHTIANMLSLEPNVFILDENQKVQVATKSVCLEGMKGDTVSIIALANTRGLTYRGLRWKVSNRVVPAGWIGIRNQLSLNKAEIRLKSGKIVVIHKPL